MRPKLIVYLAMYAHMLKVFKLFCVSVFLYF